MDWQIVIGIASIVIASCAVIVSVWHGWVTRKHNKLSCKPHLTTWNYSAEKEGCYAVELMNNGLGPALIKEFLIKVDGKVIHGEGSKVIEKALKTARAQFGYG